MFRRIGVMLVAPLLLIGLTASPGSAKTKTIRDETLPGIPTVDIKRATVGYAKRTVRTRVFSVLGGDRTICIALRYGKKRAKVRYTARACITHTGNRSRRLTKVTPHGKKRIRCRGMKARWRQNTQGMVTRIKVPRKCAKKMGRRASHFKVFAYSGGTPSDHTRRFKVRRG